MATPRVIGVFSSKGGVGKTTSSLFLGITLSKIGKDVIVVDGNISAPDIASITKIENEKHLHGVINKKYPVIEAIFPHESGLLIVPGTDSIKELSTIDLFQIEPILQKLKDYTEIVIVDTPPGRGEEVMAILRGVDEVVGVVNPDLRSIRNTKKLIEIAKELNKKILGVIIVENKNYGRNKLKREIIKKEIGERILGYIPYDPLIIKYFLKDNFKIENKPKKIWNAYLEVSSRILGEKELINLLKNNSNRAIIKYINKKFGIRIK